MNHVPDSQGSQPSVADARRESVRTDGGRAEADAESVTIGADGTVSVLVAGDTGITQVGNIQLADFVNPAGLQPVGNNLYVESGASGAPQLDTPGLNGMGAIQQGALESSNVNVVEELVSMIETQRSYEMNSKAISTTDGMLQYLNQNV